MKTIKITVYTFDELSDAAKEKARDWFREASAHDTDWHEQVTEDATQCLALAGLTVENIYFSGFASQGDGACFGGRWRAADVRLGKLMDHAPKDTKLHCIAAEFERLATVFPSAWFRVKHSGRYYHEHCTSFDVSISDENGDEIDTPEREQAEKDLIETAKDAMRWIYRQLETEYDWQNSSEHVDETIRANEYTFTAEGKRFG